MNQIEYPDLQTCINAISAHVMQPSLPFGGIGNSGMGRHGGFEGFQNFSNQSAIYRRGWSPIDSSIFYTPYKKTLDRVIKLALR